MWSTRFLIVRIYFKIEFTCFDPSLGGFEGDSEVEIGGYYRGPRFGRFEFLGGFGRLTRSFPTKERASLRRGVFLQAPEEPPWRHEPWQFGDSSRT